MRKLLYIAIGFAAACGLFVYGLPLNPWILGVSVVLGCVLALAGRKGKRCLALGLVVLGFTFGCFRYEHFQNRYLNVAAKLDGKTEILTIRTLDYSEETNYGVSVDGSLTLEDRRYKVRVYLNEGQTLEPGMLVTGGFRVSKTEPGEYLSGEGIHLIARQAEEVTIQKDPRTHWMDQIPKLRQWLHGAVEASLPEDAIPLAQALLLGDTSKLDYETDTNLKVSGIRHVVAVSGLHVSILMAMLANVTFRRKFLMIPVGAAGLVLFAALAGFSPSVTRACLMAALMLGGMLFNREYDGATALAFASIVMLMVNPMVITSVGFQLSVASVAGIFLFTPRMVVWLKGCLPETGKPKGRLVLWLITSVSVTLGATILTTPLCAWYFGVVSLVGVVTNLLALWVISGIFYGIMAVCLAYAVNLPGAAVLGKLIAWPIRYVLLIARTMADFPLTSVYTQSIYIVFWLSFVYILLIVFRFSRKRSPVQLICCVILSLCAALTASMLEREDTRITVLDVGQGQCILLEQEGRVFMVDCGGDVDSQTADLAAGYLLSRGITRLDGMILTHLDRDHAGAVENLMSRIDTELLILPPVHSEFSVPQTIYASEELQLNLKNGKISIYPATFPGSGNEMSLCILFDTEKCDILITGDRDGFGERMLLRTYDIPEVDILIAGHHGSKNSTSEELLNAVSPEIVCISAGKENPFGHPAQELLDRLAEFGCTVYRTDVHGTIIFRR